MRQRDEPPYPVSAREAFRLLHRPLGSGHSPFRRGLRLRVAISRSAAVTAGCWVSRGRVGGVVGCQGGFEAEAAQVVALGLVDAKFGEQADGGLVFYAFGDGGDAEGSGVTAVLAAKDRYRPSVWTGQKRTRDGYGLRPVRQWSRS